MKLLLIIPFLLLLVVPVAFADSHNVPTESEPLCGAGTIYNYTTNSCISNTTEQPSSSESNSLCGAGTHYDNTTNSCVLDTNNIPVAIEQNIQNGVEITIPISFQEVSGISGGIWSTTIANNVTTVQLVGILNHNTFDVINIQAELVMYQNGQIFCTVTDTISSLNVNEVGTFIWSCPITGIADKISGIILDYDLVELTELEQIEDIPLWVKGVFQFWADGQIDDNELKEAIVFLVNNGIIIL